MRALIIRAEHTNLIADGGPSERCGSPRGDAGSWFVRDMKSVVATAGSKLCTKRFTKKDQHTLNTPMISFLRETGTHANWLYGAGKAKWTSG